MERESYRRLREEIKQNKLFENPSHAAGIALLRTAAAVRRRHEGLAADHGISIEQYNVLRILRGAGGDPMPVLEIAGRLIERNPGITRLLDKLEAKGLVRRARCTEDRRQVLCAITQQGMDLLTLTDEPMGRMGMETFQALTDTELDRLVDLLDLVRRSTNEKGESNVDE